MPVSPHQILGPDVSDEEYVAYTCDQDAYAYSGQVREGRKNKEYCLREEGGRGRSGRGQEGKRAVITRHLFVFSSFTSYPLFHSFRFFPSHSTSFYLFSYPLLRVSSATLSLIENIAEMFSAIRFVRTRKLEQNRYNRETEDVSRKKKDLGPYCRTCTYSHE
jgi:hypothetical protein